MEIYICLIIIMSFITFILYGVDKRKAEKNQWRIKEITLLACSFFLGSIGGLLGMYGLRHKTKHWYFVIVNFFVCTFKIDRGCMQIKFFLFS